MKSPTLLILIMALALTVGLPGQTSNGLPANTGELASKLAQDVRTDRVSRVEIVYYPVSILTRAALSPAQLEKNCYYRLAISQEAASAKSASLVQALTATKMTPRTGSADFRWGLSVYDKQGAKTFSLYLDGSGEKALLGDFALTLDGPLKGWFTSNFGKCFDE
jgi:hypothetical protein